MSERTTIVKVMSMATKARIEYHDFAVNCMRQLVKELKSLKEEGGFMEKDVIETIDTQIEITVKSEVEFNARIELMKMLLDIGEKLNE
jgi:hypothetical protein